MTSGLVNAARSTGLMIPAKILLGRSERRELDVALTPGALMMVRLMILMPYRRRAGLMRLGTTMKGHPLLFG